MFELSKEPILPNSKTKVECSIQRIHFISIVEQSVLCFSIKPWSSLIERSIACNWTHEAVENRILNMLDAFDVAYWSKSLGAK